MSFFGAFTFVATRKLRGISLTNNFKKAKILNQKMKANIYKKLPCRGEFIPMRVVMELSLRVREDTSAQLGA